jgi:uncharacterized protein (TIGR03067 family)
LSHTEVAAGPVSFAFGGGGLPMVSVLMIPALLALDAQPEKAAADPFQDAIIAAIHHFAESDQLDHLAAVLEKYPKLVDARPGRRLGKPTTGDDFTPLQTAVRWGRWQVVGYLLSHGADVNAADGLGYTPLHLAAEGGHLAIVKRLVAAGAKLGAKTMARPGGTFPGGSPDQEPAKYPAIPARTALQIAQDLKHTEVVKFLKEAEQVSRELQALSGTWEVVTQELKLNGKMSKDFARVQTVTISNGKIDLYQGGTEPGRIVVDLTKTPNTIDVYIPGAMKMNAHSKGIYALNKDDLELCLPLSMEADRPTKFDADGCLRYVLRRKK